MHLIGLKDLSRRYGVHNGTPGRWVVNYPADSFDLPTPEPDAYVTTGDGRERPLWDAERLPEWDEWYRAYNTDEHR